MSTKTGTTQSTQKQELDPRMQEMIYGSGGLFSRAKDVSNRPAINDRMRQGLDTQYNFLTSPGYSNDYQGLRSAGNSLMSRGVAGNPFSRGQNLGLGGGQGNALSFLAQLQQQQAPKQETPPISQPQGQQLTPEMLAFLNNMMQQQQQQPANQGGG